MYKKIAITNSKLCNDLLSQIEILEKSDYDYIILREKHLSYDEYLSVAKEAVKISHKIILHTYIDACEALDYKRIHLPYKLFLENSKRIKNYNIRGVSIHSIDEAVKVSCMGASYITASHIFPTLCKSGLPPKGTQWLREICNAVDIEVYALGGVNNSNIDECINAGADGICMMSEAMKLC